MQNDCRANGWKWLWISLVCDLTTLCIVINDKWANKLCFGNLRTLFYRHKNTNQNILSSRTDNQLNPPSPKSNSSSLIIRLPWKPCQPTEDFWCGPLNPLEIIFSFLIVGCPQFKWPCMGFVWISIAWNCTMHVKCFTLHVGDRTTYSVDWMIWSSSGQVTTFRHKFLMIEINRIVGREQACCIGINIF